MASRRVVDVTVLAGAAITGVVLGVLLVAPPETFETKRRATPPAGTTTEPAITQPRAPTRPAHRVPQPPRLEIAVMELPEACRTGLVAACDSGRGVAVASLTQGGPADRARIRRGDVIVEVDGQPVGSPDALVALVEAAGPGAELEIELRRLQDHDGADVLRRTRITVQLPGQP